MNHLPVETLLTNCNKMLLWSCFIGLTNSLVTLEMNHAVAEDPISTTDVLSEEQWQQVDQSVEQGLVWLASKQQRNGSFPTLPHGQPGVTSLCIMAYMSHGHLPGQGPYGEQLQKAVDYVIDCQRQNGLLALVGPNGAELSRKVNHSIGMSSVYNHALSGLVLSETAGMLEAQNASDIRTTVRKALDVTLEMQGWPKGNPEEKGGWRYLNKYSQDGGADISITGWHLMFLRSAKNAGFDVPERPVDDAVGFVRSCFRSDSGTFAYSLSPEYRSYKSRGVSGAGVLALAHAGLHETLEAKAAGDWLLKNRFDKYNVNPEKLERYHYGLFTCSQAMYQLGGQHWKQFFPPTVKAVVSGQRPDGSWPPESHHRDSAFGNSYTTALCLITLGTPNDLLPIFQR